MAGEVPAGGGAAPSTPSAGGAPPPAAPSPSGGGTSGGTGGGAAPVPAASGSGGSGAPPAPSGGPKYLEREVMRDGKTVKERVREEALWNAHAREGALNRKFEETTKRERELQQLEAQIREREERLTGKVSFRELAKERKLDPIETLARELEEAMKEEQQNADPRQRQLLEKAREAETLRAELNGIKTERQRVEFAQQVESELEKLTADFVPALQSVKLPKNDITMRLMAEAKDTAQKYGLPIDSATLARETHKAAAGMVEGLVEGIEDDEELLEMFPKFARRLHAGLLKRHKRLTDSNQAPRIAPPKPEDKKTPPSPEGPKLVRSVDEDKAYFGNRKVLRSGI